MQSHTAGPWEIIGKVGPLPSAPESGESWVAIHTKAGYAFDVTAPSTVSREQHASNANLIAAAPELLTALRDICEIIQIDELMPESVSYMRQARAAIAKAEGR